MNVTFAHAQPDESLNGRPIFISASIPDPGRWEGEADPLEITDAVVSLARAGLTAGMRLVSAAHPTIAPLLLYVAAEVPREQDDRVAIYQSQLFEDVLPTATRRFEAEGIGRVIWTPAAPGDRPEPGQWNASLEIMRRQMFRETEPAAAVFIGGMEGIPVEFKLFQELFPGRPTYPIGQPGGEARALGQEAETPLRDRLLEDGVYPELWRSVLNDLKTRL